MNKDKILNDLPVYRGSHYVINEDQTINDIINEVLKAHKFFSKDYDNIFQYFLVGNVEDISRALFDFCKDNVLYDIESEAMQSTRSPAALLEIGRGDCKHYAGFIGGVLSAINRNTDKKINWFYRFAGYSYFSNEVAHVFIVVKDKGRELWIDPVLKEFNQRSPAPVVSIDEKINDKMLTRISGLGLVNLEVLPIEYSNDYLQTNAVTQVVSLPESTLVDSGAEPLPPDLQTNLEMLLYYGIIDTDMNVHNDIFIQKMEELTGKDADDLANAYGDFIQKSQTVGSLFGDIWNGVKQVALSPARGAYLSLVSLNVFGFATKLNKATTKADGITPDQDGIDKINAVWSKKLRGNMPLLLRAIKNGRSKNQIFGIEDGDPAIIGVAAAAAPAWLTAASAIILALAPVISGILKDKQSTGYQNILPSDFTNLTGTNQNTLNKFLPFLLIGGAALYLYLDRTKKKN